jgi:hypothetical protein
LMKIWVLTYIILVLQVFVPLYPELSECYQPREDLASLCNFSSDTVAVPLCTLEKFNPLIHTNMNKQLSESFKRILQCNVRGIATDVNMEECALMFKKQRAWAATLQETWIVGNSLQTHNGLLFINHGPPQKLCKRGSLGVSIVLSKDARKAWEQTGSKVLYYGLRIIAIRLKLVSKAGRVGTEIYLVSAYAPDSGKTQLEKDEYNIQLQLCLDNCKEHEVLVIGADTNSSVGVRSKHNNPYVADSDRVRGSFGIAHENKAGQELTTILGINELCLPTTFFKKKVYGTWIHPCSKNVHQLDHFIVKQADLKRIQDAGRCGMNMNTDHYPLMMKLVVYKNRKRNLKNLKPTFAAESTKPLRVDRKLLRDPDTAQKFRSIVTMEISKPRDSKTSQLTHLHKAIKEAVQKTLTTSERRQPGWFQAAKASIEPTIKARNTAQAVYDSKATEENKANLKHARKANKRAVAMAEKSWYDKLIKDIEGMGKSSSAIHPAQCWAAITSLRDGKSITKPVVPMAFRKDDGETCCTSTENAEVLQKYLGGVFNKEGDFDQAAIEKVRQRPMDTFAHFDNPPTAEEIQIALHKRANGKSGANEDIPVEYFKILAEDPETKKYLPKVIEDYWKSGSWKEPTQPELGDKRARKTTMKSAVLKEQTHENASDRIKTALKNNWKVSFVTSNPRRPGTAVFNRFSKYCESVTLQDAIHKGATRPDLIKDVDKQWLILHDPALDLPKSVNTKQPNSDNGALMYEEWLISRLKLLPKKGDLSLPKNWRGICLLDIASKIMSSVMAARMSLVQEQEGLEEQTGFRSQRGTIDGSFSINIGLQKRKEHIARCYTQRGNSPGFNQRCRQRMAYVT